MVLRAPCLYDRRVSAEYVDDVPYVRHFLADLSPPRLRLAAGLNGFTPPPATDFDYCELGCAHGDTLVALAAAHPEGRFVGIDLSETHVASAKRLAREGALENIGVLARDFGDLADDDVGDFDYIVAHGVLTWVSPEKRKALITFASKRLKPGGLLHVSYNAMPGWASVEPLRQLLLFGATTAGGTAPAGSLERARHGVELAHAMRRAGAEYFAKNPAASEMLDTMSKVGLPYVVHEYLHEHWIPMYFARVAWEMASSDLRFAGVLPPHANFRDTALSEAHERLLANVTDRVAFESLRDFAIDEFFRRDVFVKGTTESSTRAMTAYLDETVWGTIANPMPGARSVRLPHRTLELEGEGFEPLFAAFAEGATTLDALAQRPAFASLGREELRASMLRLVLAEHIVPMRSPTRSVAVSADAKYEIPSPYNQMMLRRPSTDAPIVLASNVAGTAFPISALEALALRAFTEVAGNDRTRWVDELVGRSVMRIRVGERVIDDPESLRTTIGGTIEDIRTRRLAKLVELGILAPADSSHAAS